jgi:hypothetical protein
MSDRLRKILIILTVALVGSIVLATLVIAYAGGVRGAGLLGTVFFISGGIVIVLAQLIPAGILLSSFVSTAFSSMRKHEMPVHAS